MNIRRLRKHTSKTARRRVLAHERKAARMNANGRAACFTIICREITRAAKVSAQKRLARKARALAKGGTDG